MYCKSSIAIVLTMTERYSATAPIRQHDAAIAIGMADRMHARKHVRDAIWRPTHFPSIWAFTQKRTRLLLQWVRRILRTPKL